MKNIFNKIFSFVYDYYSNILFLIVFVATAGSLYFSEVMELAPCDLCWYQRIFMYSILILQITSAIVKDKVMLAKYVLSTSIVGIVIAAYHIYIQTFPHANFLAGCNIDNPCTEIDFLLFGFLTIPMMSFLGFLAIIKLSIIKLKFKRN